MSPESIPSSYSVPQPFLESGYRSFTASDVDDQATSLTGWSQVYDQLSSGKFSGNLRELWLNGIHFFHESTSHTLRQSCVVNSQSWWFGIPLREGMCRLGSRVIESNTIAVRPGKTQFELFTPEQFDILGIVIAEAELEQHIYATEQVTGLPLALNNRLLKIEPSHHQALRTLLCEVIDQISQVPELVASQAVRDGIRNSVLTALADGILSSRPTIKAAKRQIGYYKIVRDVRQYILERRDEAVTIRDLCQSFEISRRTLQYAFQHVLDINPNAYLRMIRLNGVRRSLRDPKGAMSVQNAAASWGFWHLSQFAHDYRNLFGELPSDCLKRRYASTATGLL